MRAVQWLYIYIQIPHLPPVIDEFDARLTAHVVRKLVSEALIRTKGSDSRV
jgi:hypothetical protein